MYGPHRQGGTPLVPRARAVVLIGIMALAALALALVQAQSQAIGKSPHPKVTVCHATGSATNPYVELKVNQNGANGNRLNDHTSHADDIIAPTGACPSRVPPGGGSDHKVDVCHVTGSATNPVVMINIAQPAVQHHLDHGDYLADATTGCTITTITDPDDPGPNNGQTPAASVVVTQTSGVTASEQSKQAARVCTSRRSFRIRVRSKRRDPVVGATVSVNGKRVKTLKGKRVSAPVVLRGLPKGTFLVKITATTRKGRKISGTRRYKTCTPKGKRQTIPLL